MGSLWILLSAHLITVSVTQEPLENFQQRALVYAREFTSKFVAESCTENKCEFIPDKNAESIAVKDDAFVVELKGRRRIQGYSTEERVVIARLSLKPLVNGETAPTSMIVLDFSFVEGRKIPIPTK